MEFWDAYDRDRIPTGKTLVRGEPIPPGAYHLVVHICLFNTKGELLIQKRQPTKEKWPGLWDLTAGGCAMRGENSRTAAERELFEELGLHLDLQSILPPFTVNFNTGFDDIYRLEAEVDLQTLTLQPEEVQEVRWATWEEVRTLLQAGLFIPYHPGFLRFLFDMRENPAQQNASLYSSAQRE